MTPEEIQELLSAKDWSQAELSRQLGVSEAAVSRWFTDPDSGGRNPGGPARRLMRQWLEEVRKGGKAVA